jgi:hypothetical protein
MPMLLINGEAFLASPGELAVGLLIMKKSRVLSVPKNAGHPFVLVPGRQVMGILRDLWFAIPPVQGVVVTSPQLDQQFPP